MAAAFLDSVSVASSDHLPVTTASKDTSTATLIVAVVATFNNCALSDSKGITWSPLTEHVANGSNCFARIYYAYPGSTGWSIGAGHTFTFGTGNCYASGCVAWFSGTDTSGPFDTENGTDNQSASSVQPGSITPAANGAVIITGGDILDAVDTSSVTGYTLQEHQASDGTATHVGSWLGYLIQATAGATNPTSNFTGAPRVCSQVAAFKAATGGGGGVAIVSSLAMLGAM